MKIEGKKILAIGAHPDDIEYYAGGTLLKLVEKNRLIFVVATDSIYGGDAAVRRREQREAAQFIKVSKTYFLGLPDLGLKYRQKRLERKLLAVILKERPDIIFTFDPANHFRIHDDLHPDHRVLGLVVSEIVALQSTLPDYIRKFNELKSDKPLSVKPELWLFDPYRANTRVDISSFVAKKRRLLQSFQSQKLDLSNLSKFETFYRFNFYCKMKRGVNDKVL